MVFCMYVYIDTYDLHMPKNRWLLKYNLDEYKNLKYRLEGNMNVDIESDKCITPFGSSKMFVTSPTCAINGNRKILGQQIL